jgi:hypothetical protein
MDNRMVFGQKEGIIQVLEEIQLVGTTHKTNRLMKETTIIRLTAQRHKPDKTIYLNINKASSRRSWATYNRALLKLLLYNQMAKKVAQLLELQVD